MSDLGFLQRLQSIVAAEPERLAVLSNGREKLTYKQLVSQAATIGAHLKNLGAQRELIIGLCFEKSPEYLVSLLGVWFAGAAFLPLDPDYPDERLRAVLRNSGAPLLLVAKQHRHRFTDLNLKIIDIDELQSQIIDQINLPQFYADDLAYVFYTSGSTGKPKGVAVTHRGITNFIDAQIRAFRIEPGSRALQYVSIGFDASISEIGTALLSGATLCIEPRAALAPSPQFIDLLNKRKITHVCLPPALLPVLDVHQMPDCLETVIIGGEACALSTIQAWASRFRLINVYGPTEATVCTTLCECSPTLDRYLIGKVIPGAELLVLDSQLEPVPSGVPAELFIGGIGLARGYLGEPALTAAKFIEHRGKRLYRTGDRVVVHSDGEIEFLGRIDRQLKIRGCLVELEEIEARLREHPQLEVAVVVARSIAFEGKKLVAYVVQKQGTQGTGVISTTPRQLREYLAKSLPVWMLPERFVFLQNLPLSVNGKIDMEALAKIDTDTSEQPLERSAPHSEHEKLLTTLWERVLKTSLIGSNHDFFDLGGDSLKALQVVAGAAEHGVLLNPTMLYRYPTITELAKALSLNNIEQKAFRSDAMDRAKLFSEAELGDELTKLASDARSTSSKTESIQEIFLTGATGFLGSRVLIELLRRTDARIHCLVRAKDASEGRARIDEIISRQGLSVEQSLESRIVVVCGNLEEPRLGLTLALWSDLSAKIDAVYHCGGVVNSVLPYTDLYAANVCSTREILKFVCTGCRKILNYASTLSVFVSSNQNEGHLSEDDQLDDITTVYGGYAQSKWVAEKLLLSAQKLGVVGIRIYRFGLITGDSLTGYSGRGDFLSLFCKGLNLLGCIPEEESKTIGLDMTPIDYAAGAMVHISLAPEVGKEGSIYHVANKKALTLFEIACAMREFGFYIDLVSSSQFLENLKALHRSNLVSPAEAAALLSLCRCLPFSEAFENLRTIDLFQTTGCSYDRKNTLAKLSGSKLVCPSPDRELLKRYLHYLTTSTNLFVLNQDQTQTLEGKAEQNSVSSILLHQLKLSRADLYDSFYFKPKEVPQILSFLSWLSSTYTLPCDLKLLDIGCGTGRLMRGFASLGWHVVGIEPDYEYFEEAKKRSQDINGDIKIIKGGYLDIEDEEKFDLIAAINGSFYYLLTSAERREALQRIHRALKKGGVVFLDLANFLFLLKQYTPPKVEERRIAEYRVLRRSKHSIDFDSAFWNHEDIYEFHRLSDENSKRAVDASRYKENYRFAIIAPSELKDAIIAAGFSACQTYYSWDSRRSDGSMGARLMISAQKL